MFLTIITHKKVYFSPRTGDSLAFHTVSKGNNIAMLRTGGEMADFWVLHEADIMLMMS